MKLYELEGQYLELLEMLEDESIDADVVADTLEAIEGEIEIKAENIAKVILDLKAEASAYKTEIDRLSAKKRSIENRIEWLQKAIERAMVLTNKRKFKSGVFSFAIQKNPPKVVIDSFEMVPSEFLKFQEPTVDTAKVKEALKNGKLPFAHLEQGEGLRIR